METPLPTVVEAPEPRGLLGSFNELLIQPLGIVQRAREGRPGASFGLLAGAFAGYALYGAAAGFFQGGSQILVAALKVPLILGMTFLLCLPSLYVFTSMAGARWTRKTFLAAVSGFAGTLALLLLALLPIAWLFSVSSRYLGSIVWLHVLLWGLVLLLGWRFLGRALAATGAEGGTVFWLLLFLIVSFQVATFLRPVLWSDPGKPLFRFQEKMFFMEHLDKAMDQEAVEAQPVKPAASPPPSKSRS